MNQTCYAMQIEMTNFCNFRCVYCPQSVYGKDLGPERGSFTRPRGFISRALFEKAVEEAQRHARSVSIGFFGEQLRHPQFRELILGIPGKKRRFKLVLYSNWALAWEDMLDALRHFNSVTISIDATDAALWDKLCPGGPVFDKDGEKPEGTRLDALADKVRWWLSLADRPRTAIEYVVSSINLDHRIGFEKEWLPWMRSGDRVAQKSVLTYGGVMSDPHMKANKCRVPDENRFTVAWDGRCCPCNLDANMALTAGNLLESDMAAILASGEWKQMLDRMRVREGLPCKACFDGNNHSQVVFKR